MKEAEQGRCSVKPKEWGKQQIESYLRLWWIIPQK